MPLHTRWDSIFAWMKLDPPPRVSATSFAGKSILITGAAGSIGSALAAEVARCEPARLVLLDHSEQGLFRLQHEISQPYVPVLGSFSDSILLRALAQEHRFDLVFHAGAFKHLALLETQPFAAMNNNAIGTMRLVKTMADAGVARLILLSTDKAAAPTSMLGVSKRIAELVTLDAGYSVVRLGNVLGSAGSVLPLFQQKIDRGEDVVITDPGATRYFVTLSDAAQLLLMAADRRMPAGLFVPSLGEPVSIQLLTKTLLAASPASSSRIVIAELRPGEKLHERLLAEDESYVEGGSAPLERVQTPQPENTERILQSIERYVEERNLPQLLSAIPMLVPGYEPSERLRSLLVTDQVAEERL